MSSSLLLTCFGIISSSLARTSFDALGVSSSSLGPEPARRPFAIRWLSPMELLPIVAKARRS
jgi:hypothetical protein